MRLIDADKLDSYIKSKLGNMAEYELFATMIDNQPTAYHVNKMEYQLTNGWIPVSERLPEKSGLYQVTIFRKLENAHFVRIVVFNDNKWYHEDGESICGLITAWMPLPEIYKEV